MRFTRRRIWTRRCCPPCASLAPDNEALRKAVPAGLRHLSGVSVIRVPPAPLLERMWALRDNVTAHDAAYVALAEVLDAPLITCDARLATATGPRCAFDLVG